MKTILTIAAMVLISIIAKSQDIITLKNGDEINAKVIEVGLSEIKYQQENGAMHVIQKETVFMVKYQNGKKETFDSKTTETESQSDEKDDKMAEQGRQDAKKYYKKYKGAGTGTVIASGFCGPLWGLPVALATGLTSPSDDNLGFPDNSLRKNRAYYEAYVKEAKRIKSRKVWTNYAIGATVGFVTTIGVYVALIAYQSTLGINS